ncbi:DoxX family protein [Haloarchaeobius amylolyticus]|uniref:DoxX family protein n=1 Tax=Haloarchaeobius amylolyticus TaxID=1198296 RepID=UPI00226FDAFD|nr:DoxX family membrane protein [Haloarchaeobius amylolyticus]
MRDSFDRLLARLKRPLLYVMGVLYVVAGVMHFVVPQVYAQIIPPFLPAPLALVYLSGVAEIVLGLGVMVPRTRRVAAWGLIALLVAIFPANVYMATSDVVLTGAPAAIRDPSGVGRWARLPLQAVLVLWAWWYTRPMPGDGG